MKNKYEIPQNYILTLENEQLRERVMDLTKQFNELKKKYEASERERLVQESRNNAVAQE